MKILVACEESQRVCKEFRKKGHEAYSCDILPCSEGGHSEWHIQADALEIVKMQWDMVIAFPPCTHLAVSGATWFKEKQRDGRQQRGIGFFLAFTALDHVPMVAIENPIGIMSNYYRKPDQIIQPYEYGHPYTKQTCLWLKNLPTLKPTKILERPAEGWVNQSFTADGRYGGFKNFNGSSERSKTFMGVAKAMAEQWGCLEVPEIEAIETDKPNKEQEQQIRMF